MKLLSCTFLYILLTTNFVFGQQFQLDVELKSAANKDVYLAHYYLGNIYPDDTVKLDSQGKGIFKKESLMPQGLYKIYLNDKNHFDFLLGADQQFSLSNPTFMSKHLKIERALESEEFLKYSYFLSDLKQESATIRNQFKTANTNEKKLLQQRLAALTSEMQNYWRKIESDYPDTFLSKFLLSNYVPKLDISELPLHIQQNDSLLLVARFEFQQQHFWDYFDYTDERFLYTPLLKPKLETWFTRVLYQNYDSIKPHVFNFIEKVEHNKRIFQFAVSWFLNSSINSKVMGLDALFVDLAQSYYLNGNAFWASDESLKKIKENVLFMEQNLIGKTAPDLTLESIDGEYINLHQINKKRTCVLIYEPDCSHCKEFVPQLYKEVYLKYKEKGLEVFAIYSMDKKDEWTEFIEEHKMWDWINVWDKDHISQFKVLYDGRTTPGIFVLDENKKILAKKITVKQLDKILQNDLNFN